MSSVAHDRSVHNRANPLAGIALLLSIDDALAPALGIALVAERLAKRRLASNGSLSSSAREFFLTRASAQAHEQDEQITHCTAPFVDDEGSIYFLLKKGLENA